MSVSVHQCCTHFIYLLLLPEQHIGLGWKSSNKQCAFINPVSSVEQSTFSFVTLRVAKMYIYYIKKLKMYTYCPFDSITCKPHIET